MNIFHVIAILIGASLEAYAIHCGRSGETTAIVALIIGAAAGNAQTRQGQRATDVPQPKDGGR